MLRNSREQDHYFALVSYIEIEALTVSGSRLPVCGIFHRCVSEPDHAAPLISLNRLGKSQAAMALAHGGMKQDDLKAHTWLGPKRIYVYIYIVARQRGSEPSSQ